MLLLFAIDEYFVFVANRDFGLVDVDFHTEEVGPTNVGYLFSCTFRSEKIILKIQLSNAFCK